MIGLVDYDLQTSTSKKILIPNIEIMKLAQYYRTEENHFCRLINLNEEELTSYDKIFFFSESINRPNIPLAFLRANNVIFGGTAFTKGVYIPFKNELIDYTLPRPIIYKEFLKQKLSEGIEEKVISRFLDDTYYRNYAGDNKLPIPPITPRKRIILYDKDFFYPDWEYTIQSISNRKCNSIIRLHPIICNSLSDYFKARSYSCINKDNEYILDLNVEYKDISYMINHYKYQFLADITKSSNIFLPLGGDFPTNLKYANDIVYKLNLLFSFWSVGIPIRLRFIENSIGSKNPYEQLSRIIIIWADMNKEKQNKTIKERIPKSKKYDFVREQLNNLYKMVPASENLFNQNYKSIINRGIWVI